MPFRRVHCSSASHAIPGSALVASPAGAGASRSPLEAPAKTGSWSTAWHRVESEAAILPSRTSLGKEGATVSGCRPARRSRRPIAKFSIFFFEFANTADARASLHRGGGLCCRPRVGPGVQGLHVNSACARSTNGCLLAPTTGRKPTPCGPARRRAAAVASVRVGSTRCKEVSRRQVGPALR